MQVLRRRRREGGDQASAYDEGQQEDQGPSYVAEGPWDVAEAYPQEEHIDCGSLLIPVREGFDVQINVAEEQGAWVAVVHGDSGMQLQAFAAPRSSGLWDDVRHEIAANIADSGGSCQEDGGPFGTELHAEVPVGEEGQPGELHPVRFLGVDGPRWFLRGVISGPAATDGSLRSPFDEVFADVVVVRGDYPAPQRQQLEIRLPDEVRQAIDEELAAKEGGWGLVDPFERGPEITETR
jgi:Protein of unknown function (DUF3710)